MNLSSLNKPVRSLYLILLAITCVVAGVIIVTLFLEKRASAPTPGTSQITMLKESKPRGLLLPGTKTPIPLPIDESLLTRPTGEWILVNKTNPIELSYAPSDLVLPEVAYRTDKAREEVMVRRIVAEPLKVMFAAAERENIKLMIGSAYRSAALQETYFNSYAKSSGIAEAEKYSAHPGTSEHQLGLAVDLTTTDRACYLTECFEDTAAGKWLAAHVHEYGFILRYPKGKSDITGYNYEPWHFRYIGVAPATAVYESGLTYDEAFPYLSGAKSP